MLVGLTGYLCVCILPTLNEYFTIQRAVDKIAGASPATVAEARLAFDRQKDIEYSIESISGKDLEITKENDRVVIRNIVNYCMSIKLQPFTAIMATPAWDSNMMKAW